jgi:hypothetical protein
MVYKITPKELQGRKDEFVIVDVREADELEEFIANNNNNNKRHSQAAISFSASILVGFIRTSTEPSSLFLLPYASAFLFPIYRSAIFFAHLKTSFCL